ncbi:hypothetical protein VTO42DRAFT_5043 [Malbranchea cinnamomea]
MSLEDVWRASSSTPFYPIVPKNSQFFVAFSLFLIGLTFTALFGLNRSLVSIPLFGVPASLSFGFGAVLMICAAGVYV